MHLVSTKEPSAVDRARLDRGMGVEERGKSSEASGSIFGDLVYIIMSLLLYRV